MVTTGVDNTASALGPQDHFKHSIAELIKAKEAMTVAAVASKDPLIMKSALVNLLEGNKQLIAALDEAYQKLHKARLALGDD